jgi:hypothetical protein
VRPPNPLWAGTLDNVEVDLLRQRVVMSLHVTGKSESLSRRDYTLDLEDVSDFHWFSSIPGPWTYAEATEVHVSELPNEEILVEIMLWSEDAGISITAKTFSLDGVKMAPR